MRGSEKRGAQEKVALGEWPSDGLEFVNVCPICGSARRVVLYNGLRDNVFFCAPGDWVLHACLDCRSAYLNPRPDAATLHLAYRTYFTHEQPPLHSGDLRGLKYIRRALTNGYRNWRFGGRLAPSSRLGIPFIALVPFKRSTIERQLRCLPKFATDGRLLDVGFGNGAFLHAARAIGWEVTGIDTDATVVGNARARGLNVRQGDLEVFARESELFDVITLSHVIEHVHHPISVLKACYRLLKPGGKLWLETPNMDSFGRKRFQKDWRGLETPRHLAIFNHRSLLDAFEQVGFTEV